MKPGILLFACACVLGLTACHLRFKPVFIPHPLPKVEVEVNWLDEMGCPISQASPHQEIRICQPGSLLTELGCRWVKVLHLLGGLDAPLVECIAEQETLSPPLAEYFRFRGCLFGQYHTYLLFRQGKVEMLNSPQAFQQIFAPIESEEEAFSYAMLLTGYDVDYTGGYNPQIFEYHTPRIEAPFVRAEEDGFLVHLFTQPEPLCGCGRHTVYAADLLVRADGQILTHRLQPLYSFEACLD